MGYCLKLREPLSKGLQRIFREEIEAAVRLCQHPAKQRGVTVHEVRKHLKKLRAALRLTKNEVGKNRWASEDRCLREIGRLVSDLRDAHVRFQTLIQLPGHADQQFPRIEELLSMEQASFSAAFTGWQKQAIPKLERVGERLSDGLWLRSHGSKFAALWRRVIGADKTGWPRHSRNVIRKVFMFGG